MTTRTRALIIAVTLLVTAACTPHDAIQLTFGQVHGERVAQQATRVASCESKLDPGAVSPTNDHGLFQIHAGSAGFPGGWKATFTSVTGQPWAKVYDPFWNAVFAKWLYEDSGNSWSHWSCRHAA
jgi:hypothetical protein